MHGTGLSRPYLFPRGDGGPIDGGQLTTDIGNKIERELGERITMHQFRHIGADLYMREHPDGLGVISEHLGHRDQRTTRKGASSSSSYPGSAPSRSPGG